jgi:uncharacterized SAM-binding protein YcdF (DUF218 family)
VTAGLSLAPISKRALWKRWHFWAFLGAIGAFLLAACGCYFFPRQILTVDSGPVKADVLVVLGGGSTERPQRAAELFKSSEAPLIVCTGFGDAGDNQACLTNSGVPPAAILLESKSRTTQENAQFTIVMLHARHLKSAIIVTSWYHSRRALACFEHYAPDIKFYSRPSYVGYPRSDWKSKGINGYIKAEYEKLLGYWLCYGICPL